MTTPDPHHNDDAAAFQDELNTLVTHTLEVLVRQSVRRSTAYHEAGHAVAAIILCRGLRSVSIERDDWTRGHTIVASPVRRVSPGAKLSARQRRQLRRAMVVELAGWALQTRLTENHEIVGSAADLERFSMWAFTAAREDVRALASSAAREIHAVASALLEHGKLSGVQVREIVAASPGCGST